MTKPELSRLLASVFNQNPPTYKQMFDWANAAQGKSEITELPEDLQLYLKSNVSKHLAGKHDQSTHGHSTDGKTHTPMHVPTDDDRIGEYNLVSSTKPYVGLSNKAQEIAARISPSGKPIITSDNTTTTTRTSATYTTEDGETYDLNYERLDYKDDEGGWRLQQKVSIANDDAYLYVASVGEATQPAGIDYNEIFYDDKPLGYSIVSYVQVENDFRNKGLATAMLEFARRESPEPIYHSSSLSGMGEEFARTTKGVEKHLAGKHDQSTHAGSKNNTAFVQPKIVKTVDEIPLTKTHFTKENNPELSSTIKAYCSTDYGFVNNGLRGPRNANHIVVSQDNPDFIRMRDDLDKAMNLSPTLSEPIQVFRGIPEDYGNTLEIGKIYSDKGFSSVSLDKKIADGFSPYGTTRTTLRMTIPKGQKVFVPTLFGIGKKSEKEIILPRSTPFKVVSVETNEYGKFIDVEIIDE